MRLTSEDTRGLMIGCTIKDCSIGLVGWGKVDVHVTDCTVEVSVVWTR